MFWRVSLVVGHRAMSESAINHRKPVRGQSKNTRFQLLSEHFQVVVLHDKQLKQDFLRRKSAKITKWN
jgi:hypothetical protein